MENARVHKAKNGKHTTNYCAQVCDKVVKRNVVDRDLYYQRRNVKGEQRGRLFIIVSSSRRRKLVRPLQQVRLLGTTRVVKTDHLRSKTKTWDKAQLELSWCLTTPFERVLTFKKCCTVMFSLLIVYIFLSRG